MEFFEWLDIPRFFMQAFSWAVLSGNPSADAEAAAAVLRLSLAVSLAAAGVLYLVELILGGFGMKKLAARAGIKHPFLGFLPFANTWYAGKLAGEANFFGQRMKRAGLYAMLLEIGYVLLEIFTVVLSFFCLQGKYLEWVPVSENSVQGSWGLSQRAMEADGKAWMLNAINYCDLAAYLVRFLVIIFICVVFIAFFRKYFARSPILMTLISVIFPLRGFTVFAVRNNAAVDYNEYLRRRMESYRPRPPYGGGGSGGPDQGGSGQDGQSGGDDPFGDFSDGAPPPKDDDPFSDF